MITYREATLIDAEAIAQLHSRSWQQNYRGIWTDDFLDGPVLANRRAVWHERLDNPVLNQLVIVAEEAGLLYGFACAYAGDNALWGTLLDNLHVVSNQKGKGIGTQLLKSAARWSYSQNPDLGLYLWVLTQNTSAQQFYQSLGAVNQDVLSHENPGGGASDAYRYVWTDIKTLL
ncbi:GNAT family N-acetyltransferase [Spirosoma sp.]|uniref:GNAT family N-acetyltransferase n=1 Tax=Spirosoma sp. TaxID=1899569 RepID=UPI0026302B5E|nr:GNAT family N-acetyltransferase [Spirosoma sp.]MCX6213540.1 GNAT family N-acetyltransferase [Spirosoma sp.]